MQDIEVPVERLPEFLEWFLDEPIGSPVWLCPLRLRDPCLAADLPARPGSTYVNVGFWASVPIGPDARDTNRMIEAKVTN